jgi:hypothetical protein
MVTIKSEILPRMVGLYVPDAASFFSGLEIFFIFKDKCENKINNNWRTNGEKGQVNKIHTYRCRSYTKLFSYPGAHSKCLFFEPGNN